MADKLSSKKRKRRHDHHKPRIDFVIPSNHHLLITTPQSLHSWDNHGVHEILYQENGGFVSAKEAGNGSGLVAVATGLVVMLWDKIHGSNRIWRLRGTYDHVTSINFSNNFQELFYSTCLQNSIIRYSIAENRVIGYSTIHPSPPMTFGVSSSSKFIITASPRPPIIYLQDLSTNSSPIVVRPHASNSLVTVVQFHPRREKIFLLAYEDGTVSVHALSRILLMETSSSGSDGNIGHLSRTHHHRKHHRSSIVRAAFMPAYELRLITVNQDGKCRIVDFEHGTAVIRTWNVGASCTSLAIVSLDIESSSTSVDLSRLTPTTQGQRIASRNNHVIAIGRADGYVDLYDDLGLLGERTLVEKAHGPIVDLDWALQTTTTKPVVETDRTQIGSISQVNWAFALPHLPHTDYKNELAVHELEEKSRSKNHIPPNRVIETEMAEPLLMSHATRGTRACSEPARFRPQRSPRKTPLAGGQSHIQARQDFHHVHHSPLIPGAWVSSSNSSGSIHSAQTSQELQNDSVLSERQGETQMAVPKVWNASSRSSPPGIQRVQSHARNRLGRFREGSGKPTLNGSGLRIIQGSEEKTTMGKEAENTTPTSTKRSLGFSPGRRGLFRGRCRASSIPHDGARSLETEKPRLKNESATIQCRDVAPLAPTLLIGALQMSPAQSVAEALPSTSPPVLIPNLASLVQRLRVSSSTVEEWAMEDVMFPNKTAHDRVSILDRDEIIVPKSSIVYAAHSPDINKPLPPPPFIPGPRLQETFTDFTIAVDDTHHTASATASPLQKSSPARATSDRDAEESHSDTKGLHIEIPPCEQRCECDCSEVVREQMGLVLGEIASLRKTIWCFGSGVGWGQLVDHDDESEIEWSGGRRPPNDEGMITAERSGAGEGGGGGVGCIRLQSRGQGSASTGPRGAYSDASALPYRSTML